MKKYWNYTKEIRKVILILGVCFTISMIVEEYFEASTVVPAIMALAIFLISRVTDGFLYGVIASVFSVLLLNFAFAFPYFAFNFNIPENIISAVIMLIITIMTSTLTTQLKWQEKVQIESEKEKMRGNLLRAVSHDLRTPLTTICGSSATIVENYEKLSQEQILQLAQGICDDSQWLMRMVENILLVTRIDNENVKIVKTSTVLEELIDAVLIRFKKAHPEQNVMVDIPEEFISIPMDAVLIEQVIFNLLENAVQHAKGMTEIRLSVSIAPHGKVVFQIQDNGCGIEKERLKHLFKNYFQMQDGPVDNQKKSMGIGLAVCASIIKAHNGTITASNRKEGGCTFRFTLDMEMNENESL